MVTNGRTTYLAAQTLASEAYGKGDALGELTNAKIMQLAGLDATLCTLAGTITMGDLKSNKPTKVNLKYSEKKTAGGTAKDIYYNEDEWTSETPTQASATDKFT